MTIKIPSKARHNFKAKLQELVMGISEKYGMKITSVDIEWADFPNGEALVRSCDLTSVASNPKKVLK